MIKKNKYTLPMCILLKEKLQKLQTNNKTKMQVYFTEKFYMILYHILIH